MKKAIIHGLITGGIASLAAIIYDKAYSFLMAVNFSKIVPIAALISVNFLAASMASLLHLLSSKISRRPDLWFNLSFSLLTFASFLIPFVTKLPLNIEAPELFIGLVIPMHLFPLLFWLVTKPMVSSLSRG